MRRHILAILAAGTVLLAGTPAFAQLKPAFGPPTQYSSGAFYGFNMTLLGDVDGDHQADLVAFDGWGTWVMLSSGTSYGSPTEFSSSSFSFIGDGGTPGAATTLLGDINGDGRADAVGIASTFDGNADVYDEDITVMLSTGTAFEPPRHAGHASGSFPIMRIGDVDGDRKADLVMFDIGAGGTWVMQWNGTAFTSAIQYASNLFSGDMMDLADVDGDGKADAVSVSYTPGATDFGISVMLSDGPSASFGPATPYGAVSALGEVTTALGDVDGDGKADLVVIDDNSSSVLFSNGTTFGTPTPYSSGAFYGDVTTLVGDVNGDGKADAVAVNRESTWVMLSTDFFHFRP